MGAIRSGGEGKPKWREALHGGAGGEAHVRFSTARKGNDLQVSRYWCMASMVELPNPLRRQDVIGAQVIGLAAESRGTPCVYWLCSGWAGEVLGTAQSA